MVPARNRWLYPVSPRVVWCGWFYYTIKQNRGRPISQPRNEQERGREGAVFNPYPVPTPRSIWPFNFLRPLNLLFSPPCLCLLEARRNSILGIGRPCPFPVLVTDLSLCNPCTFLISWTILPKKKRKKKKCISLLWWFYYSLSKLLVRRHSFDSMHSSRELQLTYPVSFFFCHSPRPRIARIARHPGNRDPFRTRWPCIFRFNYLLLSGE